MKVKEFIKELSKFPEDMDVFISDGFTLHFYQTDTIHFKSLDNTVDIGIGGCEIED